MRVIEKHFHLSKAKHAFFKKQTFFSNSDNTEVGFGFECLDSILK